MRGNFFTGLVGLLLTVTLSASISLAQAADPRVSTPHVFLEGIPYDLTLSLGATSDTFASASTATLVFNNQAYQAEEKDGEWVFTAVTARQADT
ncbi:MAG: hypothetical protein VW806_11675, partial [Halieaceae bacterium]